MITAAVLGAGVLLATAVWVAPPALAARVIEPALGMYAGQPSLPDELEPAAERSVVYDADGGELATLFRDEHRVRVGLEDVSDHLRDAVVATEDHRFEDHPGIHHRAIARAAWENWRADDVVEGGSTITQQLVKQRVVGDEASLQRKAAEAYLALQLERRMDKDEILETYLNQLYLGQGAYGVGTAAELYFSKDVADVDLAEAATLAGAIRAPERGNPIGDPDRAQERRDVVLQQMAAHGVVDEAEADAAMDEPLALDVSRPDAPDEPFFVAAVTDRLLADERLGADEETRRDRLYTGGLEIRTTLDPDRYAEAGEALEAVLDDPEAHPQASVVAVEPGDGAVTAMAVGPRAWGECDDEDDPEHCPYTHVNPATPGLGSPGRQPGSAFKPFVAAAALEEGVGVGWQDTGDSEESIPGCEAQGDGDEDWSPSNYGGTDAGVLGMAQAMVDSNNVYHAKLGVLAGLDDVVEAAERAGLQAGDLTEDCAVTLGAGSVYPVDMASAYATFANGGQRCDPYLVSGVDDGDGEEMFRHEPECTTAFDEDVVATLTDVMGDVVTDGTGTAAAVDDVPIAGKTGTTQDWRDAWFAGYTGGDEPLAAAVWVGHEEPAPLEDVAGESTVTGGSLPAEMFSRFMAAAADDRATGELDGAASPESISMPDLTGGQIDEVLDGAEEVPSDGDPAGLLDADDFDGDLGDAEHYATDDFGLHLVVYEVTDWRSDGEVLAQSVDGGAEVSAGTLVAVAVSDGEGDLPSVPDVIGVDAEEAAQALGDAGYEVDAEETDVEVVIAPRDPEAFVEAQEDPESAAEGDVPDEFVPAPQRLEELPEEFVVVEEPEVDGLTVAEQDPDGGTPLEPGETVQLAVARLDVEFEMPDVEIEDDDADEPDEAEGDDETEDDDEAEEDDEEDDADDDQADDEPDEDDDPEADDD